MEIVTSTYHLVRVGGEAVSGARRHSAQTTRLHTWRLVHFGGLLLGPNNVLVGLPLDALLVGQVAAIHLQQAADHDDDKDAGQGEEDDLRGVLLLVLVVHESRYVGDAGWGLLHPGFGYLRTRTGTGHSLEQFATWLVQVEIFQNLLVQIKLIAFR